MSYVEKTKTNYNPDLYDKFIKNSLIRK